MPVSFVLKVKITFSACDKCYFKLVLQEKGEPQPAPAPSPVQVEQTTETDKPMEAEPEVDPSAVTPRSKVNLEATATGKIKHVKLTGTTSTFKTYDHLTFLSFDSLVKKDKNQFRPIYLNCAGSLDFWQLVFSAFL